MPGRFITFEGIEGSGKSTQVKILEDYLRLRGHDVVVTREPGGTRIGDQIRRILLDAQNADITALAELLLYGASRAQHVHDVIRPALDDGRIVLCDRFTDATTAYQGYGRGLPLRTVRELNRMATGGLAPDLTILVDCPVEIGIKRARERIDARRDVAREDRLEQEELAFHDRVRQGYLDIAEEEAARIRAVDGTMAVDPLHQRIVDEVLKCL